MVRPNGTRMMKNGQIKTPKQMLMDGDISESDVGYKQFTMPNGDTIDVMVLKSTMQAQEKPFTTKPTVNTSAIAKVETDEQPISSSRFGRILDDMEATEKRSLKTDAKLFGMAAEQYEKLGGKPSDREMELPAPEPRKRRSFSKIVKDYEDVTKRDNKVTAAVAGKVADMAAMRQRKAIPFKRKRIGGELLSEGIEKMVPKSARKEYLSGTRTKQNELFKELAVQLNWKKETQGLNAEKKIMTDSDLKKINARARESGYKGKLLSSLE